MKKKKVDKTQCRKCLFRYVSACGEVCFCIYILLAGHPRPCEPSPNCTVYKPYTKKERLKLGRQIVRYQSDA